MNEEGPDQRRGPWSRGVGGAIVVAGILIVAQYILAFFVLKLPGLGVLQWIGWGVWVLSLVFAFGPIFILRQRGGVQKGRSYIHTTRLVDSSLYAIVRHPQYLGGMLFNLALMLLAQHWLVILLGAACAALIYWDMRAADREGIDKFGDDYRRYMRRAPRANLLLGPVRWLRQRGT